MEGKLEQPVSGGKKVFWSFLVLKIRFVFQFFFFFGEALLTFFPGKGLRMFFLGPIINGRPLRLMSPLMHNHKG